MNALDRQRKRRAEMKVWCRQYLGNKCAFCLVEGNDVNGDYFCRNTPKGRPVTSLFNLSRESLSKILDGCVLCCRKHAIIHGILCKGRSLANHGSSSMYSKCKCRCRKCIDSNTERCRVFNGHKVGIKQHRKSRHGTRSFYVNKGCRCAECKSAERDYQILRRKRKALSC